MSTSGLRHKQRGSRLLRSSKTSLWLLTIVTTTLVTLMTSCSADGDAFTSSAVMQELLVQESVIVQKLEEYLSAEERRLNVIREKLAVVKKESTRSATRYDITQYMAHPVNAYNLLRQWHDITEQMKSRSSYSTLQQEFEARHITLPQTADLKGAQEALLRLQKTYKLDTMLLANGTILGRQAEAPLKGRDLYDLGKLSARDDSLEADVSSSWLETALESQEVTNDPDIHLDVLMRLTNFYSSIGEKEKAFETAVKASALDPSNERAKSMVNFIQEHKLNSTEEDATVTSNRSTRRKKAAAGRYESLCRGPIETQPDLTCQYKQGTLIPYIHYKEETLNLWPKIVVYYDVISDVEGAALRTRAYPAMRRALVGNPAGARQSENRVSKVGWLWDEVGTKKSKGQEPDVLHLTRRIQDITGLDTKYREKRSSAEPFQVVNYGLGGQYNPHYDYFKDEDLKRFPHHLRGTGNRLATFLFYLNDVQAGGATVFPLARVRVSPVKNAAAFWYNIQRSGRKYHESLHAGCPVLLGEKWVANKWIREYGQEFRRPCGLKYLSWDD